MSTEEELTESYTDISTEPEPEIAVNRLRFPMPYGAPPRIDENVIIFQANCMFYISRSYERGSNGLLPWELADESLLVTIVRLSEAVSMRGHTRDIDTFYIVFDGNIGRTMVRICAALNMEFNSQVRSATFAFPTSLNGTPPILSQMVFKQPGGDAQGADAAPGVTVDMQTFEAFKQIVSLHTIMYERSLSGFTDKENRDFSGTADFESLVKSVMGCEEMMGDEGHSFYGIDQTATEVEEDLDGSVSSVPDFIDSGFERMPRNLIATTTPDENGFAEIRPAKPAKRRTKRVLKKKTKKTSGSFYDSKYQTKGDDYQIAGSRSLKMKLTKTPCVGSSSDTIEEDQGSMNIDDLGSSSVSISEESNEYAPTSTPFRSFSMSKPKKYKLDHYDQNSNMVVAGANNDLSSSRGTRTFVIRGNQIGIFAEPDPSASRTLKKSKRRSIVGAKSKVDADMKYIGALETDKLTEGDTTHTIKDARPTTMLLKDNQRRLLVLDSQTNGLSNYVYDIDVDYQKVISTYNASKLNGELKLHLRDITGGAGLTGAGTSDSTGGVFIGLTQNGIHAIDSRVSGPSQLVSDVLAGPSASLKSHGEFVYGPSSGMNFTCATTAKTAGPKKGTIQLAVGDERGDIRLFDKVDVRPKTLLNGYGQPIRSIDISVDGRYIVATCVTFLIFFDTLIQDGKDRGEYGYSKRMGEYKNDGIILSLKAEDMAKVVVSDPLLEQNAYGAVSVFTPAKFSVADTDREMTIVSGIGDYLITWSLRDILAGRLKAYSIKHSHDHIVSSAFQRGSNNVIVTTSNDVYYEPRTAIKTRRSRVKK